MAESPAGAGAGAGEKGGTSGEMEMQEQGTSRHRRAAGASFWPGSVSKGEKVKTPAAFGGSIPEQPGPGGRRRSAGPALALGAVGLPARR